MKLKYIVILLLVMTSFSGCVEPEETGIANIKYTAENESTVFVEEDVVYTYPKELEEIVLFLMNDTTDQHEYLTYYTCGHFTRDLARNASKEDLTIGGAILSNHPVFRGSQNHIVNYVEIGGEYFFIDAQTDWISFLDEIHMKYKYIRLYPDGTQTPSNWGYNLAPTLVGE